MAGLSIRRQRAYRRGQWAEHIAALFLCCKGYRILERRYRASSGGEVDIIARRGRCLVAVEVKARDDLTEGMYAVTSRQQQRIIQGMQRFMQKNPWTENCDIRFDVVVMRRGRWPYHIKNAWLV